eukprot:scaffold7701_cov430-Prasinococcus_capsulatus_cf.AAC.1
MQSPYQRVMHLPLEPFLYLLLVASGRRRCRRPSGWPVCMDIGCLLRQDAMGCRSGCSLGWCAVNGHSLGFSRRLYAHNRVSLHRVRLGGREVAAAVWLLMTGIAVELNKVGR